MTQKKHEIHLVSHTHWDREWYSTFQEFRMRLVRLINQLLQILDTNPKYKFYVLDGQTIVLEDYLEIHPENRERIRKYIKQGRLLVGPWYVQPDEFLVSGESLIRNLLIGHGIAREFGPVMKIGYQPDAFGHVSQFPQILRGFGIDNAMIMRGIGNETEKIGLEFQWKSPDGSEVLAIHLFPTPGTGGYSNLGGFGFENMWARKDFSMDRAFERIRQFIDLLGPLSHTPYLLGTNGGDHVPPQSNLHEIIAYCNGKLTDAKIVHSTFVEYVNKLKRAKPKLATHHGELRRARYMPLLVNVLSSRLYIKQRNFVAQNTLEKYAEPLGAFAFLEGKEYPEHLLRQAWKYLVQTHPHDTICGCSIDEVHQEAMQRTDWVLKIGNNLADESLEYLTTAPVGQRKPDKYVSVFNTLPWKREAEVEIDGEEYSVDVPACGYKTYRKDELKSRRITTRDQGERVLENSAVKVEVKPNGTLTMTDKTSGLVYPNLNYFEDAEDCGDLYNFSPAEKSLTLNTLDHRPVVTKKAGKIEISYELRLPVSIVDTCKKRSDETTACPLKTTVSLAPHSPVVRIVTEFDNRVKDHRLRVGFNPGIVTDFSMAEGQFDVVKRSVKYDPEDWVQEHCLGIHPQQNFVAISQGGKGLLVANKGLPEYEHNREKGLFVTLVRGVEWINALGWINRKVRYAENGIGFGHAPGGQCLGSHRYEYALIPFSNSWEQKLREVYNYVVPLKARESDNSLPGEKSFLSLEPDTLLVSAIKKAENRNSLIVRIFNPTSKKRIAHLRMDKKVASARLVRLDETPVKKIAASGKEVKFEIGPAQIQTLELRMAK